ncbi:hypothetical protein FZC79_10315 [Rossellomorea vietnamensis]|uniref:Uncharacterized protein n=1 Tax=Rossellomorea vietnamensis TaxID=218284 RepID=A0A5D4KFP4_9BACI|nr:hypothetical protein [Rossellomorea vietnamensis]TYR75555.1 hypothetical protein FZC79_10315 [Rossellomorea vietnamensis]
MTEFEKNLQAVREVFVDYPKRYENNETQLKRIDQEIQDILHVIELNNFNAAIGYKLSKELQKARQERRRIKDELEMMDPIKELLAFPKPTEKNISKTIGSVRQVITKHGARTYRMRIREDLQEMI